MDTPLPSPMPLGGECERCPHPVNFELLDRVSGRVYGFCSCCLLNGVIEIDDLIKLAQRAQTR